MPGKFGKTRDIICSKVFLCIYPQFACKCRRGFEICPLLKLVEDILLIQLSGYKLLL
jgi:hypothetical protein